MRARLRMPTSPLPAAPRTTLPSPASHYLCPLPPLPRHLPLPTWRRGNGVAGGMIFISLDGGRDGNCSMRNRNI